MGLDPLRHWRVKVITQWLLQFLPRPQDLNYVLQTRVTRSLPRSDVALQTAVEAARTRVDLAVKHLGMAPQSIRALEIGVGWDLAMPLSSYCLGIDRQVLFDLNPLLKPELVRGVAERLRNAPERLYFARELPVPNFTTGVELESWLAAIGIEYRAPADALRTGLDDESIDVVWSRDVLEHVPTTLIPELLEEAARIVIAGGVTIHDIDHVDHYSYSDRRLGPYNSLKFSELVWHLHNPPMQYQNRMRSCEYLALFTGAGWHVVHVETESGTLQDLRQITPTPRFRALSVTDLLPLRTMVVARKASTDFEV